MEIRNNILFQNANKKREIKKKNSKLGPIPGSIRYRAANRICPRIELFHNYQILLSLTL